MSMNDLDRHIETLRNGDILREPVVKALCNRVKDILVEEANIQRVQSPVNIVGDLHGQLHDLIELFRVAGEMPQCNYLFLGDYVDRGYYSVETFLLLVALKVRFLDRVTLIRGNHESRQITQVYGFFDECLRKYASVAVWRLCAEVFDFLALAALVDDAALCVHGGLSPNIKTLDEIRSISRRVEVPHEGAMCDLLWSDPSPDSTGWHFSPRGAGFLFGEEITRAFNHANGIDLVCRAHQLVMDGYNQMFYQPSEEPSRRTGLVTVWSAPNYCYRCGNIAAVLRFNEHLDQDYLTFEAAPRDSRRTDTKKPVPDYFL